MPRFSDLEQDYICTPRNVGYEQLAAFVAIYHAAVDELLACEIERRNGVGTYCGNKDG